MRMRACMAVAHSRQKRNRQKQMRAISNYAIDRIGKNDPFMCLALMKHYLQDLKSL